MVINATTYRLRPIALTADAAPLGMIPIASEVFWGAMAYAIIGSLFVTEFIGKGQTDAIVSTSRRYIGAGLPDISRPSAGPEPFDHPRRPCRTCRTCTGGADAAR